MISQNRVHVLRTATLQLGNTLALKQAEGGKRIPGKSQLTRNRCLRQKHIKNEIRSQPAMCQAHTGAYVSLRAPYKTDYSAAT